MPDYSKGKIYYLRSHQTDEIYIGSTTQSLAMRKGGHKGDYKRYLNGTKHFMTSFNITKYDDCYIELIEEYACENKQQLDKKEGQYIRDIDCVNKYIAGRTPKEYSIDTKEKSAEYYQNNKDTIKEQHKKWYENNKDQQLEKAKERYQNNKDKVKEKNVEWYQKNKDTIKGKRTEYYQKNKDKIKEKNVKNKDKITEYKAEWYQKNKDKKICECGSVVTQCNFKRHKESKKHLNFMENKIY